MSNPQSKIDYDKLSQIIKELESLSKSMAPAERPQRIGEIRYTPLDLPSPQPKHQDWIADEFYAIPLPNLPKSIYVIQQPKPTRWQRFKNKIKKLIK